MGTPVLLLVFGILYSRMRPHAVGILELGFSFYYPCFKGMTIEGSKKVDAGYRTGVQDKRDLTVLLLQGVEYVDIYYDGLRRTPFLHIPCAFAFNLDDPNSTIEYDIYEMRRTSIYSYMHDKNTRSGVLQYVILGLHVRTV